MRARNFATLAFFAGLCLGPAVGLGATPCSSSSTLCLTGKRFTAEVQWKDFSGNTGSGHAVSLTSDTGYFWFFSDTNVELVVKVLDGRALNGHFWVFYGALSNVEYTLTVRDLETGDIRVYENPSGQFASTGDTSAFPPDPLSLATAKRGGVRIAGKAPIDESAIQTAAPEGAAACTANATTLCLGGGRFRVAAAWTDFAGNTGVGQAVALTSDTGYFWFFSSTNVELVVKALDGRALNDSFWIFYGALSNVAYTMTVTDTVTGIVRTYENPSSLFASVGDTSAFGKPTTFELIDGAVVKGEITDETALLYKVYAFFGDARLPQAYVGDPPGPMEHGILHEVAVRWPTLSAPTQQLLEPFLIPPIYPESWFSAGTSSARKSLAQIRSDWTRIETARAAVWYRAADAGAETAAGYLAASIEKIWDTETGLMQREPPTDAGLDHNGGDGKLDTYLLPTINVELPPDLSPRTVLGVTCPYPGAGVTVGASYILVRIPPASTVEGARLILAHEFFHTIARTFKHGWENGWMNEATATWTEDFVYPTKPEINNQEQAYANPYLAGGFKTSFELAADRGYQDYLFFFYLARSIASAPAADVNRRIWENAENVSALEAIDSAIPGGFKERWPEFAMYCWNQPDVDKFNQWDNFTSRLDPSLGVPSGALQESGFYGLPSRAVPHLAMAYAYFEINDTLKRVEIQTQPVISGGNAKTQAWIKLANGSTRVEDWTDKTRVVFCRDKADQAVTKLLILYTNSGKGENVVWGDGLVITDTAGCGGFRGVVQESRHSSLSGQEVDETMDSTATFLPNPGLGGDYYLAAITMVYSFVGHDDVTNCTLTIGPVTQTATFQPGESDLNQIVIDNSAHPPTYSAMSDYGFLADAKGECPGKPPGTVTGPAGGEWFNVPPGFYPVNPDGSLSGDYTDTEPGTKIQWIWRLTPD